MSARKTDVGAVLAKLRRLGSRKHLAGYARFAIPAEDAYGVPSRPLVKARLAKAAR